MKKIFGKIDTRREEKENEKAHSSFIGKKYNVGKHTVVVEVKQKNILLCCNDQESLFAINCYFTIVFFINGNSIL